MYLKKIFVFCSLILFMQSSNAQQCNHCNGNSIGNQAAVMGVTTAINLSLVGVGFLVLSRYLNVATKRDVEVAKEEVLSKVGEVHNEVKGARQDITQLGAKVDGNHRQAMGGIGEAVYNTRLMTSQMKITENSGGLTGFLASWLPNIFGSSASELSSSSASSLTSSAIPSAASFSSKSRRNSYDNDAFQVLKARANGPSHMGRLHTGTSGFYSHASLVRAGSRLLPRC